MNAHRIVDILLEDEDFDMESYVIAALTPLEAYNMAKDNPELRPQLERVIATSARYSYGYARYYLKGKPFPLGEPAIATDAGWSYEYAFNVIERRFPLGEPAIATNRQIAVAYNHYVGTNI